MKRTFELLERRMMLDEGGLIHTSHEVIPNYAQDPDTVTIADGNWFDPAIWSNGVPTAEMDARVDHAVVIAQFGGGRQGDFNGDGNVGILDYETWLAGYGVNFDDEDLHILIQDWLGQLPTASAVVPHAVAEDINVIGKLSFAPEVQSSLTVTTLTVLGSGILEVGTADSPITGSVDIVFRDAPFDFHFDPQQLGHGLIVVENAALSVYGCQATSFVEVAEAPRAGSTSLLLADAPMNWLPGDELWIADTRHTEKFDVSQNERLVIEAVSGNEVRVRQPLAFDHFGSGSFLPHVAHLSGNVTFRSENPDGVRGHIIAMGRANIRVHNAVFDELGRTTSERLDNSHLDQNRHPLHVGTNHIGRYAFHLHHLIGPEGLDADTPQYELVGNRFTDGRRWAIAVHDTHYGLVADNAIVNFQSAGIVFEDGSEFGNRVEGNFIGLIPGSGQSLTSRVAEGADPLGPVKPKDPRATHASGVLWGDGTPENPFRTLGDLGHEGAGIWGRSASNHIVDNVIADTKFGNVLWTRFFAPPPLPAFKGANPREDGIQGFRGRQYDHEFGGNQVYNAYVAYQWQGVAQGTENGSVPHSVFVTENNDAWNIAGPWVFEVRYSGNIEILGGEFRGSPRFGSILKFAFTPSFVIDGIHAVDFRAGLSLPTGAVRNSYFENMQTAIMPRSLDTELENNMFVDVKTDVTLPRVALTQLDSVETSELDD